jgi:hypothetical protein
MTGGTTAKNEENNRKWNHELCITVFHLIDASLTEIVWSNEVNG